MRAGGMDDLFHKAIIVRRLPNTEPLFVGDYFRLQFDI